ncbi:DUF1127 domain-containing protein [Ciceribacter sp. L1K23]|uniref:DUF1127 domain-containing protein n=1 Tax=unclassified Ciceribacter TaxID=2628820 RepID=UPI001ABEAFBB|nr:MULTISPECIES: DUF1127 domain-containing protein [unclassified Ciceribacter]MBO3758985.1 DUF1127 domain-containing protein [Ciceribacter sp. L1K22]MBR0556868.1 DUF1127 domain-containing protein [Ciceribacter sp. L1K23]
MTMTGRLLELDIERPVAQRGLGVNRLWSLLADVFRALVNRHAATRLADLDDALLNDIGLTRSDVERVLRTSPLSEDPTRRLSLVARAHAMRALPPV